jgi:hypothetical protein
LRGPLSSLVGLPQILVCRRSSRESALEGRSARPGSPKPSQKMPILQATSHNHYRAVIMETASTFTEAEAGACFVGEDYSPPQVSDFHGRRQLQGEARRTLLLGRTTAGVVRRAARSSPGRA